MSSSPPDHNQAPIIEPGRASPQHPSPVPMSPQAVSIHAGAVAAPLVNVIDFSRNSIEEQDTYMKLINVNTFESLDYGIGIRRSVSQATHLGQPKRRKRN